MVYPLEATLLCVIFLVVGFKHVLKKLADPCKVFLHEIQFASVAFKRHIEELAHAVQGQGKNKPMSLNKRV